MKLLGGYYHVVHNVDGSFIALKEIENSLTGTEIILSPTESCVFHTIWYLLCAIHFTTTLVLAANCHRANQRKVNTFILLVRNSPHSLMSHRRWANILHTHKTQTLLACTFHFHLGNRKMIMLLGNYISEIHLYKAQVHGGSF